MAQIVQAGTNTEDGEFQVLGHNGAVVAKLSVLTPEFDHLVRDGEGVVGPGRAGGGRNPLAHGPQPDAGPSVGELDLYVSTGEKRAGLSANGHAYLGGGGADGSLGVLAADGDQRVGLSADGSVILGGAGADGSLAIVGPEGQRGLFAGTTAVQCLLRVGGIGRSGQLHLMDTADQATIMLDGAAGDITLAGADCAEEFDVDDDVEPGAVVVAGTRALSLARDEYDSRVVGIVSGLGSYRPALVLDRRPSGSRRLPVALLGKVSCLVDADYSPIERGDLLTSSPTAGHAMAVRDRARAFGCVIGKSLSIVSSGRGIADVLVMSR